MVDAMKWNDFICHNDRLRANAGIFDWLFTWKRVERAEHTRHTCHCTVRVHKFI